MCGSYRFDPGVSSVSDIGDQVRMPVTEISVEAGRMLAAGSIFRPYNYVPVLALDQEGRPQLITMYWQLIHFWSERFASKYTNFNTRAESLPKRHNQDLLRRHRCLLPATSFFESRRGNDGLPLKPRQSYEFFPDDKRILFLGGIYSVWKNPQDATDQRLSCSIITMEPNQIVGEVHPRMPYIVPEPDRPLWLDGGMQDFNTALELITPIASASLRRFPEM